MTSSLARRSQRHSGGDPAAPASARAYIRPPGEHQSTTPATQITAAQRGREEAEGGTVTTQLKPHTSMWGATRNHNTQTQPQKQVQAHNYSNIYWHLAWQVITG